MDATDVVYVCLLLLNQSWRRGRRGSCSSARSCYAGLLFFITIAQFAYDIFCPHVLHTPITHPHLCGTKRKHPRTGFATDSVSRRSQGPSCLSFSREQVCPGLHTAGYGGLATSRNPATQLRRQRHRLSYADGKFARPWSGFAPRAISVIFVIHTLTWDYKYRFLYIYEAKMLIEI